MDDGIIMHESPFGLPPGSFPRHGSIRNEMYDGRVSTTIKKTKKVLKKMKKVESRDRIGEA